MLKMLFFNFLAHTSLTLMSSERIFLAVHLSHRSDPMAQREQVEDFWRNRKNASLVINYVRNTIVIVAIIIVIAECGHKYIWSCQIVPV